MILWPRLESVPPLRFAEVHLWAWSLFDNAPLTPDWLDTLSSEERARAAKFVFPQDCRRYLLAHAGMRRLLAEYLGCSPAGLAFGRGEFEKPYLLTDSDLRFNLSHSANLAVLAVTRSREVGVDVERCTADVSSLPMAQLSLLEQEFLRRLPAEQVSNAFYATWTRKEALLKGLGVGLFEELSAFSTLPDVPRAELHVPDGRLAALTDFESANVAPAEGYAGAVTVNPGGAMVQGFSRVF